MNVLLVWDTGIGIELYKLTGNDATLALVADGQYINGSGVEDSLESDAVELINQLLKNRSVIGIPLIGPFTFDAIVRCGWKAVT